jgi:hypothetical protein
MKPNLKTLSLFTVAGGLLAFAALFNGTDTPETPKPDPTPPKPIVETTDDPVVQIAILLDTSSSMDGLIEQAKSQLWKIVNTFDPAKLDGKRPRIEIAVYEYGNDSLSPASGYIRQVIPFTDELDRVSEKLFALTTNGGSEFAGMALETALNNLAWSTRKDALKFAFIAGNEDFAQGPTNPVEAIRRASEKGIVVNTIYCGSPEDGIAPAWKNGAVIADGRFMTIDQNQKIVHIDAPQDQQIAQLSQDLNGTYIAYGRFGEEGARRQAVEDSNSGAIGQGSAVQRGLFKSSAAYKNSTWELGDAVKDGKLDLANVDEDTLPANMKGMSKGEREAYVKGQLEKREQIQTQIRKLASERDRYVAEQQTKLAQADEGTLDAAMIDAVRGQASKMGYQFE